MEKNGNAILENIYWMQRKAVKGQKTWSMYKTNSKMVDLSPTLSKILRVNF